MDLEEGDAKVDLACGRLPWKDGAFSVVISQHVIEHLELTEELLPLLTEIIRVMRSGGEVWVSCPDLAKACSSYESSKGKELLEDREMRKATGVDLGMAGIPTQHFINKLFHQGGQHLNLFDEELLSWALSRAGFVECRRTSEQELLARFPDFPPRGDDFQSLYLVARKR